MEPSGVCTMNLSLQISMWKGSFYEAEEHFSRDIILPVTGEL